MQHQKHYIVTWDDFQQDMNILAERIETLLKLWNLSPHEKLDYIVGIPRGGIIPAVWLSHKINVPLIDISTLDKMVAGNKEFIELVGSILFVDEICDSGKTFRQLADKYDNCINYTFASLHMKTCNTKYTPETIFVRMFPKDIWVKYPWESSD